MGKKKEWAQPKDTNSVYRISRADFQSIIEQAIRHSGLRDPLARTMRDLARVAPHIAFNSWSAKSDANGIPPCGCPLSEAGYTDFSVTNRLELPTFHGASDAKERSFYEKYDNLMRARFGTQTGIAIIY